MTARRRRPHVLVARLDNAGDVLLTGPAVRAVAGRAARVTMVCGPRGRAAAELLPGVDAVVEHLACWIDPEPPPLDVDTTSGFVDAVRALDVDEAVVFTSFHQSPLPLALLLRMAGVPFVAAISDDYPGSLLDIRHRVDDDLHEVERALSLAAAAGYRLPDGDDGCLAVRRTAPSPVPDAFGPYVVVHPGASVPARAWEPDRHAALVDRLVAGGRGVVVTGTPAERDLTARVAGPAARAGGRVLDLGGATDLAELAAVIAGAGALVVGNTGPAHLAAAVGTPVVSLYAPTVPAERWRPWRVPSVVLGRQDIECAGCRARTCPVAGHPCLAVPTHDVVAALDRLAPRPPPTHRTPTHRWTTQPRTEVLSP